MGMATKKTRKRPYTPPPSEVESKKQSEERRTVRVERPSRADRFYTLPNGRRMPIPPKPTFRRLMRQLPFYFLAMLLVGYFTIPFEGDVSTSQKWSIAAIQALPITMLMLPVLYLLDRARWNRYLRLTTRKSPSAS
jgi:hypothetical protein